MSKTQLRWQGQPAAGSLACAAASTYYIRFPISGERAIICSDAAVRILFLLDNSATGVPTYPAALAAAVPPGATRYPQNQRVLQANVSQIIESNVPFRTIAIRTSGACNLYFELGAAAGD